MTDHWSVVVPGGAEPDGGHEPQDSEAGWAKTKRLRDLDAEAARVSAEFGLGAIEHIGTAKQHTGQWKAGTVLLALGVAAVCGFIWANPMVVLILGGASAVAGIVLMALSRSVTWDRRFLFEDGVAEFQAGWMEPRVLRWADLESLSVSFEFENDTLDKCEVRDTRGATMTAETSHDAARAELAAKAEHALETRVLPGLIAAFDAGEPVRFGGLAISRSGLAYRRRLSDGTDAWRMPLEQVRRVAADGPGRTITIRPDQGRSRSVGLDGRANGVLAHRVLEHALAGASAEFTVERRY